MVLSSISPFGAIDPRCVSSICTKTPGLVEATGAPGDGSGELKDGGVRSKLNVTCRAWARADGEFPGLTNRKSAGAPVCLAASTEQSLSYSTSVSAAVVLWGRPTG